MNHLLARSLCVFFGVFAWSTIHPIATAQVPPHELDNASLIATIEAELQAWEEALVLAEAEPPPQGSRRAVLAEIQRLSAVESSGYQDQIAVIVRQAARKWLQVPTQVEELTTPVPTQVQELPTAVPTQVQELPIAVPAQVSAPSVEATRLLTLPGAMLQHRDGTPVELPPFTILYAHSTYRHTGQTWFEVGRSRDAIEGSILESQTEEWRSMLVMQYAPLSGRERTLFFRDPDDIRTILRGHFQGPQDAQRLYRAVEERSFDPDMIIAIEPERRVQSDRAPYFMPIINFRRAHFDDMAETPVFLLQLAAVNLQSETRGQTDDFDLPGTTLPNPNTLRNFRAGIVFVVDTTTSMGPYIDEVQQFLVFIRQRADQIAPGQIDFGLIGYRDYMGREPRLEYVTREYLPLGTQSGQQFDAAVQRIGPSPISTSDWREDSLSGLQDAIETVDWSGYDARFVILVTDAGPRGIGDSLARDPELGPRQIGRIAARRNISLQIMHMQTPEGQSDHASAIAQYRALAEAFGETTPRHWMLTGNAPVQFGQALRRTGEQILESLQSLSQGTAIVRRGLDLDDPILRELIGTTTVPIRTEEDTGLISAAFGDQFFAFQQDYLGQLQEGKAPLFYRAWVADRDLINPRASSMLVKVLVTRDQLSDLASRLRDIVRQLDQRETGTQDAFVRIAGLSGVTAYDPNLTIAEMLPEYLSNLPYVSNFMAMTAEQWGGLGLQQQGELLDQVRDRIRLLEQINAQASGWLPLPSRSTGEEVYPLDLGDLP